jgi:superfamily II DNA or RNA helicase
MQSPNLKSASAPKSKKRPNPKRGAKKRSPDVAVPNVHNWKTSDEEEIARRKLRAKDGAFTCVNERQLDPIFSNFRVGSEKGLSYSVEIRDLANRVFACECVDFRINGLGTCKHVEHVLLNLQAKHRKLLDQAHADGSPLIEIEIDRVRNRLRVARGRERLPATLRKLFDEAGWLVAADGEGITRSLELLKSSSIPDLRISQEIEPWMTELWRAEERKALRREYELRVQSGEWPAQETSVPLFPYQREGMLHLAFSERGLLADEMGLGKTIQAIAACALLHRLEKAKRVLVVTPASLKTEWEEQIQKYSSLSCQLVFGPRAERRKAYCNPVFFTVVNYEQMLADSLEVNQWLRPDVVVLDEAQRIKNWSTKTSQAIKRLQSRYAFVLTGTPIENRIDELHSIMGFINPTVLGSLFRFNRDFYTLDDRGRPAGYQNLDKLHERVSPYILRRRKSAVETELPARTDRTFFVPLSPEQKGAYEDHEAQVARLSSIAKRRPLTQQEQDKLMRELAMMRMVCDTNYILNSEERACPKLKELQNILEECRENEEVKVIIFSEWQRMLELVRELCESLKLGYAWHTGSVPQLRRRGEILAFKNDPKCRVFLSTDSGSTGLNLQVASVVVNCDLPWNPAKLEQRIARAWRKHQLKSVTVINLVSENTIEHRMLGTLANKQALADGVLDRMGDLKEIKLQTGGQSFIAKIEQLLNVSAPIPKPVQKMLPADRSLGFAQMARQHLGETLVRCEERFPQNAPHSVLIAVVDRDAAGWKPKLESIRQEFFGPGLSDPLAPTELQVIDRATFEAMEQMISLGLIISGSRVNRVLFPESASVAPTLSAEQQQAIDAFKLQAGRKIKMARLLSDGELLDEARESCREAALLRTKALAVEKKFPEPSEFKNIFTQPYAICWDPAALESLRSLDQASNDCDDAVRAVEQNLKS